MTGVYHVRPLVLAAIVIACIVPGTSRAQAPPTAEGWDSGRWRFGPLAVTPALELRNLGWDGNVFNDAVDPKSDLTATAAVPIDWWLRVGRARVHGADDFEGVWFATYDDQRSFNQRHDLTLIVLLNRVRPYVGATYVNVSDRPGYEINARVHHTDAGANGGLVVRLTSRIDLDLRGRQTVYRYDDVPSAGLYLSETLDRRTGNYGARLEYRYTSETSFTLLADSVRERFTTAVDRDNDGYRILPGVEFGRRAIITGRAQVGFRKLDTLSPAMPDFSGLVASIDLSYTLRGATRFTIGASRDVYFSYDATRPFYIQPGFTLSVARQITGPWDIQARGSWYRLDYQQTETPGSTPLPSRSDRYTTFGGGVGYKLGGDIRIGFNLDSFHRDSMEPGQSYEGLRGGMAVTYVVK